MALLENEIKRVNDKLQQLLKQYAALQKENEKLKSNAATATVDRESLVQRVDQLELQVSILKSAAGQMTDADKKTFEKKISQYIKDVDKCITLLSE